MYRSSRFSSKALRATQRQLLSPRSTQWLILSNVAPTRGIAMVAARILRNVLKIRYILLGGAIGGGISMQKTYESWRDSLPDTKWLQDRLPPIEKFDAVRDSFAQLKNKVMDELSSMEIDPRLTSLPAEKYSELREWFQQRLDDAILASQNAPPENHIGFQENTFPLTQCRELHGNSTPLSNLDSGIDLKMTAVAFTKPLGSEKIDDERKKSEGLQDRLDSLQSELIQVQIRYQRELEKLERDNKELRRQLYLKLAAASSKRHIKKSLIDMYSEVLDELCDYDRSYQMHDHLPRVVVVGDQSSGKTSVLEMIAQARIFPRGAGEMMTRAPVKVTLSEGPYHIAQFKDSAREFDLSKETDLADLRREVEIRMKNSVRNGMTVSNEVISMTVKGPGLQRMVLVDLPGIISTVTQEMHEETRESIRQMSCQHMANPNAIILCIQDGSVDAERSNVTDLVSQMDPQGKRTIFVLTKIDMAENNISDPTRIQRILSGKLFPMKALGYFAVVTGRGNQNDSIQQIKDYEEKFFSNTRLFKSGHIPSSQVTTRNLSLAVSECFWKMVRETVEQQADAFKATRFNLETEWKNSFPRIRELDRDELFEKAKGEFLDEVVNLGQLSTKEWEDLLTRKLWEKMSTHVFENIYLPAAQSNNPGSFRTLSDIRLWQWAEEQLPLCSVQSGWEALRDHFRTVLVKAHSGRCHDTIFDPLKQAVAEEALNRHKWEDKAAEVIRVIQLNALEDRSVHDKHQWDRAVAFLETSIKERLQATEQVLHTMMGPSTSEKWLHWKYPSTQQQHHSHVRTELEKLINADPSHGALLTADEVTTIRQNLQTTHSLEVSGQLVQNTWSPIYRRHFLKSSLSKCYDCRKAFYMYHQGIETELDCSDVVLFWRVHRTLEVTANALRQQVMNREARRLEREIRDVLDDFSQDTEKKQQLLTGRRVQLAEELKRVRQIQEKLEEFIVALNSDKS